MATVIDIRTALEQLGTGWQFGGSVTDGTQEAWDAVVWEDTRSKPTWDALCAAHEGIILQNALTAIEAKYAGKQAELDSALVNALWAGGPQESSSRIALMAERQKLIDNRDAEIAALFV